VCPLIIGCYRFVRQDGKEVVQNGFAGLPLAELRLRPEGDKSFRMEVQRRAAPKTTNEDIDKIIASAAFQRGCDQYIETLRAWFRPQAAAGTMSEDLVKKQLQEEKARCDDLVNEFGRLSSELQSASQHGESRSANLSRQRDEVEQRRRVSHDCVIRLQNELLLLRQTGKTKSHPNELTREEQTPAHEAKQPLTPRKAKPRKQLRVTENDKEILTLYGTLTGRKIAERLGMDYGRYRTRLTELRQNGYEAQLPYTRADLTRKKPQRKTIHRDT